MTDVDGKLIHTQAIYTYGRVLPNIKAATSVSVLCSLVIFGVVLSLLVRPLLVGRHSPSQLLDESAGSTYTRIPLAQKMTLSVCTTIDRAVITGKQPLFPNDDSGNHSRTLRDLLLSQRYHLLTNKFDGISSFHLNYPFCAALLNLSELGPTTMINMMVVGIGQDVVMNQEVSALCDNSTYWPYRWKTISARWLNETGHQNLQMLHGRDAYLVQQLFWTEHGILPCDRLTPAEMIGKLHQMHGLSPLWNPYVEAPPTHEQQKPSRVQQITP